MATLTVHLPPEDLPHDVEFEIRDAPGAHHIDLDTRIRVVTMSVARYLYEAHGVKNALTELPEAQA